MKLAKRFERAWVSWWLWFAGAVSVLWTILLSIDLEIIQGAVAMLLPYFPKAASIAVATIAIVGAVLRALPQEEEES